MRWTKRSGVVVAALALAVGLGFAPAASAAPLPVDHNFLAGIPAELANPGGSLPGSNDYGCKPSPEHPNPVVLVHGTAGSQQTNWISLVPALKNEGYCVFALTYGELSPQWPLSRIGGLGDKTISAWQLKLFVDNVLAKTGAEKVDIVGHSQGTQIPTYWAKYYGGARHIDKYVSLAPFWQGSDGDGQGRSDLIAMFADALGLPPAAVPQTDCPDCVAAPNDDDFAAAIDAPNGPYVEGITYTNIATRYDQLVTPYTSGILAGPAGIEVTNIVVQDTCSLDRSDHLSIVANQRTEAMVLNALDPKHPRPVPCLAVPPYTGA
ncbi:lipase [Williamsia sp. 1138]|uniref:esterase/lipase family protein n=1 Tax=Williamsia sp. 1138 TaxID=1903117 RepID=UPI000A11CDBC|nr:alpha/beta fold hydrolase [Williamsia sp. 1138]OZG27985.1 lipase [Williamsia sp. 1138]